MVEVQVSIGELFDKLTILQIKKEKITDTDKLSNVRNEYDLINQKTLTIEIDQQLVKQLKDINLQLWDIEDQLRIKEKNKEFDSEFVELAREVYYTNDRRADIKKQINISCGSLIVEEKQYVDYERI